VISPFVPLVDLVLLVLAFFDSSLRGHFWPFTGVLGRIWRFVTRKDFRLSVVVLAFFWLLIMRGHFWSRLLHAPFIRDYGACQETILQPRFLGA